MEQNTQNLPATYTPPATYAAPAASAPNSYFTDMALFENGQRMAKLLAASDLVPQQFRNNIANTLIALEMSTRTGSSPLAVMQSMYIVHGRPSWSATFIIASINACGRYSPLRFKMEGEGDELSCRACAIEKETGEMLTGPPVSIKTAKAEGWFGKQGSKWQTMPELMLHYRAATLFGRLYAADILMGMRTDDELDDIGPASTAPRRVNGEASAEVEAVPASGAAAINALLEGDAPTTCHSERSEESPEESERPRQEAGDASSPAAPRHDSQGEGGAAPPEHQAMMRYIAEIDAIDDPEALRSWWQGKDYKKLSDELGGMSSEFHKAVAEHVQARIRELEGRDEAAGKDYKNLPLNLVKYLERKK